LWDKVIDYLLIRLAPADESQREFSYQVRKAAYGDYITQIWGWDEDVQRDFHAKEWEENKPEIIIYDCTPIGTIIIVKNEDNLEIRQFIILPEYQNKGIGSYLLQCVLDEADRVGQVTTLRFLKNNPVKSLYVRCGFKIIGFDGTFYSMERKPGGSANL